jgi:hypothetical protein
VMNSSNIYWAKILRYIDRKKVQVKKKNSFHLMYSIPVSEMYHFKGHSLNWASRKS